jgi:hypothetical protein
MDVLVRGISVVMQVGVAASLVLLNAACEGRMPGAGPSPWPAVTTRLAAPPERREAGQCPPLPASLEREAHHLTPVSREMMLPLVRSEVEKNRALKDVIEKYKRCREEKK